MLTFTNEEVIELRRVHGVLCCGTRVLAVDPQQAELLIRIIEAALPKSKKVKVYRYTYTHRGMPFQYQSMDRVRVDEARDNHLRDEDAWDISKITEHEQEVTER